MKLTKENLRYMKAISNDWHIKNVCNDIINNNYAVLWEYGIQKEPTDFLNFINGYENVNSFCHDTRHNKMIITVDFN